MVVRKLNAFHHKGLRKILGLDSTYVNRANTNARLFEVATQAAGRPIVSFSQMLDARRVKLAGHILRANSDPLRQISYQPNTTEPFDIGRRRVGRPRQQWLHEVNSLIFSQVSHYTYDNSDYQNDLILQQAQLRNV